MVGASDGFITPASIGAAPLDSPAFTGVPTAPNPSPVHNNDQTLATTKFVKDTVAGTVGGSTPPTGNAGGDLDPVSTYPAPLIKPDVILRGNPTLQTRAASRRQRPVDCQHRLCQGTGLPDGGRHAELAAAAFGRGGRRAGG